MNEINLPSCYLIESCDIMRAEHNWSCCRSNHNPKRSLSQLKQRSIAVVTIAYSIANKFQNFTLKLERFWQFLISNTACLSPRLDRPWRQEDIQLKLNNELDNLHHWLLANKLSLNVSKTEYMIIGSRQRLTQISTDPKISIGSQNISRVKETKTLGVLVDENITWKNHIDPMASQDGCWKKMLTFLLVQSVISWIVHAGKATSQHHGKKQT